MFCLSTATLLGFLPNLSILSKLVPVFLLGKDNVGGASGVGGVAPADGGDPPPNKKIIKKCKKKKKKKTLYSYRT